MAAGTSHCSPWLTVNSTMTRNAPFMAVLRRPAVLPRPDVPSRSFSCLDRLAHALTHLEAHLAILRIHHNVVSVENLAVEDLQRQRVLNKFLDCPLQGPRSEVRIVAFGEEQLACRVSKFERYFAISQQASHIFQSQLDYLHQLLFAERSENNDVVHAVQELRFEVGMQCVHHLSGSCPPSS